MKDVKVYCDMCGILIDNGDKDCASLNMSPRLYDSENKYHEEWAKDFFDMDLCPDCYSRLKKDFMSRMVTK